VESNGRKEGRMRDELCAACPTPSFFKDPTGHHHPPSPASMTGGARRRVDRGSDGSGGPPHRNVTYVRFPSQPVFEFFRTFACGLRTAETGAFSVTVAVSLARLNSSALRSMMTLRECSRITWY
jgi:hypothetical protein